MKNYLIQQSILIFISIALLFSCKPDNNSQTANYNLAFSADTVTFDTVFTGIGTATKLLKVYNSNNFDIELQEVFLAKDQQSNYRLNINGLAANRASNLVVAAKDSIHIFIEATIDPNRDQMVEQDSIIFRSENQEWDIDLVAFGQDVVLLQQAHLLADTIWTNQKPFLVYDYLYVAPQVQLTIEAGTQLHFHRGARFYVEGSLQTKGKLQEPVVFQSDRLEQMYNHVPGQWAGIYFLPGSQQNSLVHTEVKNAIIGIQVDTFAHQNQPVLVMHNTKVQHMTAVGVYARGTNLEMYNCLIADCGQYALACIYGGNYKILNTTVANYWLHAPRNTPSVVFNNYFVYENNTFVRPLNKVEFANNIVYGSLENELAFDLYENNEAYFNFAISHSAFKLSQNNQPQLFSECLFNEPPQFTDRYAFDFHLDTLSPLQRKGSTEVVLKNAAFLSTDLDEVMRPTNINPDMGAYQRVDAKKLTTEK